MAVKKVTRLECTCEKCGYHWISRLDNPAQCPKCKTAYWNRPREKTKEKNETE
jgi:predicted Zn-ribbon and HTH transcriptional regulator